jgi:cysteine desulfurase
MAGTYFDHNATTPVDPRVRESMLPWIGDQFGNPSSIHAFGQAAREAVERAREQVATLLDASPAEIVFTATGTEANNAVIRGCSRIGCTSGHLVVSAMDHPSVAAVATDLESSGFDVSWIAPDANGRIDPDRLAAAIKPDTSLVCLALANNIIGTIQPVEKVARFCRKAGVPILCDAVQAIGKIPVSVRDLDVDFLSLGAHKFYGPLGAAALWIRKGVELNPYLLGGSQERHRRAGTVNVPAIVGMGEAAELVQAELEARRAHLLSLRDRLETGLREIGDIVIHGEAVERLPNTTHVALKDVDAQSLLIRLDLAGFAVSAGSACSSGTVEPSPALLAMGVTPQEALSSLRISLGSGNTEDEVDRFLVVLAREVAALRQLGTRTSV